MLFTTGYLTKQGVTDDGRVRLSIPNCEIKNLFIKKIREWFSDTTANDGKTLEQFCNAFVDRYTARSAGLQSKLAHQIKHRIGHRLQRYPRLSSKQSNRHRDRA